MVVCNMIIVTSNDNSQIHCWKLWVVAVILLAPLVMWFVLDAANSYSGELLSDLAQNASLQAAATIAGLAVFGSAIGIRIYRKPETKDAQWKAQVGTYIGITLLVATQGSFMTYACCTAVSGFWTAVWIAITTILMIVIVALLTVALSRHESDNKRITDGLRKELENIHQAISNIENKGKHDKKMESNTAKYLSHDIYDSLLATGQILYINQNIQQTVQNIANTIKRHNEYLKKIERIIIEYEIVGDFIDDTYERMVEYEKTIQKYRSEILRDVEIALSYLAKKSRSYIN